MIKLPTNGAKKTADFVGNKLIKSKEIGGKVIKFSPVQMAAKTIFWPIKTAGLGTWYTARGIFNTGFSMTKNTASASFNMATKATWKVIETPLNLSKVLIWDNTIEAFKGLMDIPKNIKETPSNIVNATKNQFNNSINSTKNIFTETAKTGQAIAEDLKNAISWNPLKIINNTRRAIFKSIKLPFQTTINTTKAAINTASIPFSPAYGFAKPFLEPTIKGFKNLGVATKKYPENALGFYKEIGNGAKEIKNGIFESRHAINKSLEDLKTLIPFQKNNSKQNK